MTPFDPNYTTNIEKRYIVCQKKRRREEETYTLVANSKHEVSSFEVDFADSRPERDEREKKNMKTLMTMCIPTGKLTQRTRYTAKEMGCPPACTGVPNEW